MKKLSCFSKSVNMLAKRYNFIMSVSEDLKILLLKEKMTITELAQLATQKSGNKYTVYGISQKLSRNSMKYDELKFLAKILGYEIKFEKFENI